MTKGTGWQKLAEIFLPIGKLSWIYPTAAEWAPQALKTVGQGHSPGWLVHEPLIWGQQNIGKFYFKKSILNLKSVPIMDAFTRTIWPASKKYENDERFEYATVHEENSRLFSTLMDANCIFRE